MTIMSLSPIDKVIARMHRRAIKKSHRIKIVHINITKLVEKEDENADVVIPFVGPSTIFRFRRP